jgi:hypothetical protein
VLTSKKSLKVTYSKWYKGGDNPPPFFQQSPHNCHDPRIRYRCRFHPLERTGRENVDRWIILCGSRLQAGRVCDAGVESYPWGILFRPSLYVWWWN